MGTTSLLLVAVASVAILLLAVIRLKAPAFLALLGVSILTALVTGIPVDEVVTTVTEGLGGTLGNVALLVGLGTMLGKLIEISGGARALAEKFRSTFGERRLVAALVAVAFLLAIPVFFDVGFIVLVPIIYGFAVVLGADPVKVGLPVGGIMLAIHVTVPPHPGVVGGGAVVNADIGWVTVLGLLACLPLGFLSYYAAQRITRRDLEMLPETAATFAEFRERVQAGDRSLSGASVGGGGAAGTDADAQGGADLGTGGHDDEDEREIDRLAQQNPATWGSVLTFILLPIAMIMCGTVGTLLVGEGTTAATTLAFIGAPAVALLVTTMAAYYWLGVRRGMSSRMVGKALDASLAPAAIIILVTGAGGVFGKVLTESGIGDALAGALSDLGLPLIVSLFLVAAALRVSQGSATVAIVTTMGLLAAAVTGGGYTDAQVALLVLAAGFGALGFSHINDSGFWVVTRFLGLSVADGLRTWTVLTTLLGVAGFGVVLVMWGLVGVAA